MTEPAAEIFGKLMSVPDAALGTYWELLLGEPLDAAIPAGGEARARRAGSATASPAPEAGRRPRRASIWSIATTRSPTTSPSVELGGGDVHLPALLRDALGLSGSEARRLIAQGAVRLDGERSDRLDVPAAELRGSRPAGRQAPLSPALAADHGTHASRPSTSRPGRYSPPSPSRRAVPGMGTPRPGRNGL